MTVTHFDGGRLRSARVTHSHVVEHPDGEVTAIVVRDVPALVCELCEEHYYEPHVTESVVAVIEATTVVPGRAIAVQYPGAEGAG
jgi:YgiT-type zinc finger domain-containing protein